MHGMRYDKGYIRMMILWQNGMSSPRPSFNIFPMEMREECAMEFDNLKKRAMSVWEYRFKFTQLARYAPQMLPNIGARFLR